MKKDDIRSVLKMEKKYGIFRGIANVELVCDNDMVIHVIPEEEAFEKVYGRFP